MRIIIKCFTCTCNVIPSSLFYFNWFSGLTLYTEQLIAEGAVTAEEAKKYLTDYEQECEKSFQESLVSTFATVKFTQLHLNSISFIESINFFRLMSGKILLGVHFSKVETQVVSNQPGSKKRFYKQYLKLSHHHLQIRNL